MTLPNVRKLFLPDPEMEFFDIDLDSADLRIVTWESDCRGMKEMFSAGLKPYVEAMKIFYDDPKMTKDHPSYKTFKAFSHATNYLGTPRGLSSRLPLSVRELERMQDWYFTQFPEIKTWQDKIKNDIHTKGFIENPFGYRLYIFDRISNHTYNEAIAWLPQSTVACLINRAFLAIFTHEPEIEVLLQVHDSLAGQYPLARRDYFIPRIIELSSIPLPYSEPLVIPVGIKTSPLSWGDC